MKKIRISKPLAYILIIIVSLIIGIVIGVIITSKKNNEEPNPISANENFIYISEYEDSLEIEKNYVFTEYEEFYKKFKVDTLTEKDFQNNNYVVIPLTVDDCSESNVVPTSYIIDEKNIEITISYTASCGLCAPKYLYYLLKVDKKTTDINLNLVYKSRNEIHCDPDIAYKPLIYLYPEEDTKVTITLSNPQYLTTSYPIYDNSWEVNVKKDGTIIKDNREYYGLYWEGNNHKVEMKDVGFIVEDKELISFLECKLSILGLNDKEADEFIIYWLPKLQKNKYNYIYFENNEEINSYMSLNITPNPDSIIRIFMDYKPLDEKIDIEPQVLQIPQRTGFTVVEWGGSIIK